MFISNNIFNYLAYQAICKPGEPVGFYPYMEDNFAFLHKYLPQYMVIEVGILVCTKIWLNIFDYFLLGSELHFYNNLELHGLIYNYCKHLVSITIQADQHEDFSIGYEGELGWVDLELALILILS